MSSNNREQEVQRKRAVTAIAQDWSQSAERSLRDVENILQEIERRRAAKKSDQVDSDQESHTGLSHSK